MSDITKRVNPGIYGGARLQSWDTSVDLNDDGDAIDEGDIFRIKTSLKKTAKSVTIQVASGSGSVSVRLNPVMVLYPRRPDYEMGSVISQTYNLLAQGTEIIDATSGAITIPAGESFTWAGEVMVDTLSIVSKSADFVLIVS